MAEADPPRVWVVYALADRQDLRSVPWGQGLCAADAIQRSGLLSDHPELDGTDLTLGVFGQIVAPGHLLQHGDRVEIYRPLQIDPRDARRRAARQTTNQR